MILGLDIATRTGWALYDGRSIKTIRAGHFDCAGDHEQKTMVFAERLISFLRSCGDAHSAAFPTFACIEQPQRNVQQYRKKSGNLLDALEPATEALTINAGTALQLNQLTGAAIGVLTGFNIQFETVAPATWRNTFFGKGVKAADRAGWKRMAIARCRALGIEGVKGADAAEAVGIAFHGGGTQTWRMMNKNT